MANKECPSCHNKCGPRTNICKHCQHVFRPQCLAGKPENLISEWKNLEPGQYIYVHHDSGPYRIAKGIRKNFGESGEFRVEEIREDGILCKRGYLFHFIYMGPNKKMSSGTYMRPHIIQKLNKKENDNGGLYYSRSRPKSGYRKRR